VRTFSIEINLLRFIYLSRDHGQEVCRASENFFRLFYLFGDRFQEVYQAVENFLCFNFI
jgi:hypothetical protein